MNLLIKSQLLCQLSYRGLRGPILAAEIAVASLVIRLQTDLGKPTNGGPSLPVNRRLELRNALAVD